MRLASAAHTAAFAVYVGHLMCPMLRPARLMVLDNVSFDRADGVRELVEAAGWQLLFLPLYSPNSDSGCPKGRHGLRVRHSHRCECSRLVPPPRLSPTGSLSLRDRHEVTRLNEEVVLIVNLDDVSRAERRLSYARVRLREAAESGLTRGRGEQFSAVAGRRLGEPRAAGG